jgi:hypothetical protein
MDLNKKSNFAELCRQVEGMDGQDVKAAFMLTDLVTDIQPRRGNKMTTSQVDRDLVQAVSSLIEADTAARVQQAVEDVENIVKNQRGRLNNILARAKNASHLRMMSVERPHGQQ